MNNVNRGILYIGGAFAVAVVSSLLLPSGHIVAFGAFWLGVYYLVKGLTGVGGAEDLPDTNEQDSLGGPEEGLAEEPLTQAKDLMYRGEIYEEKGALATAEQCYQYAYAIFEENGIQEEMDKALRRMQTVRAVQQQRLPR